MEAKAVPIDSSRTERLESIGQSSTGSWEGGRLSKLAKSPAASSAMRDRIVEEDALEDTNMRAAEAGQTSKLSKDALAFQPSPQSPTSQVSTDGFNVPQHIPLSQFQSTWKEKPRPQREGYGFRPRSGASTPTTPGLPPLSQGTNAAFASSSGLTSQLQQHNLHHPQREHVGGGEQQDKGLATPGSSRIPESRYQDIASATQGLAGMNINARQAAAVREGKQRAQAEDYDEETDFKGFSADASAGFFDEADDVDIVDAAGLGWPGESPVRRS